MERINISKKAIVVAGAILVVVLSVAIYYAVNWNSDRLISEIEFEGHEITALEDLKSISVAFEGNTFEETDLSSLKNEIESLPYVQSADVYRSGFESLNIEIIEEKAIAFIIKNNGQVGILADSGKDLPYKSLKNTERLIILRTEFGSIDSVFLAKSAHIINELSKTPQISLILSELVYIGKGQFKGITSYRDLEVLLGTDEEIEAKANRLISFWKNYIAGSIPEEKNIDLRWGQKVIMY